MILQMNKKKMGKKYGPKNLFIKGKKFGEKESKSRPEKSIAERLKLRWQKKFDNKDLADTSSLEGDDSHGFVDVPDFPPLEDYEE